MLALFSDSSLNLFSAYHLLYHLSHLISIIFYLLLKSIVVIETILVSNVTKYNDYNYISDEAEGGIDRCSRDVSCRIGRVSICSGSSGSGHLPKAIRTIS